MFLDRSELGELLGSAVPDSTEEGQCPKQVFGEMMGKGMLPVHLLLRQGLVQISSLLVGDRVPGVFIVHLVIDGDKPVGCRGCL